MDLLIDVLFELSGLLETFYFIFAIAAAWAGVVLLGKIVKKWR